jgi:hypothetical protein
MAEIFVGMEFGSKLALQKDLSLVVLYGTVCICAKKNIGKF